MSKLNVRCRPLETGTQAPLSQNGTGTTSARSFKRAQASDPVIQKWEISRANPWRHTELSTPTSKTRSVDLDLIVCRQAPQKHWTST